MNRPRLLWIVTSVVLAATAALVAAPASADSGRYPFHEVARFGGYDPVGSPAPGMFVEPTGFAVDAQEGNAQYVADRTSSVEGTLISGQLRSSWRIQKIAPPSEAGAQAHVLGTTSFTLPGGARPAMVAGLAVDHAAGRVYALVMAPSKSTTYREHAVQAQELLAWSTTPTGSGEIAAATGLPADTTDGTTGGLVSSETQLSSLGTLYDPQGIVVDQEGSGPDHPVAIEATDLAHSAITAGEALNGPVEVPGGEGTNLFEFEAYGDTIVQQVATSASNTGKLLKRWSSAAVCEGAEDKGCGPHGILDDADGSISVLLNGRGVGASPYHDTTNVNVVRLNAELEKPLVVNDVADDPPLEAGKDHVQGERRAILGLDSGPFFTDPSGELDRTAPFEPRNAGAEVAQLENGLYAADLRFEPGREEAREEVKGERETGWLSFDTPFENTELRSLDSRTNVGIRLLEPNAEQKISGEQGEAIVNTLGNGEAIVDPPEGTTPSCNVGAEEPSLAAGSGGTLWVLDRGPTVKTLDEGLGLNPGREIIELAPGEGPGACPQPSLRAFTMGLGCESSRLSATEALKVPADASIEFNASSVQLTHGRPFAYEWEIDYEGKRLEPEDKLLEEQEARDAIEYTPTDPGTYTVHLKLWNDYGAYMLEPGAVDVTAAQSKPEAGFSSRPSGLPLQEAFNASPGEQSAEPSHSWPGTCNTVRYYVWNWGDGSPPEDDTTPEVAHTYKEAGTYTVELSVVNSRNESSPASVQSVSISPPAPEPNLDLPELGTPLASTTLTTGPPSPPAPPRPSRGPTLVSPRVGFADGALSVKISCPAAKVSCAGMVEVETAAAFPASAAHAGKGAKAKPKASRLLLGQARFSLAGGASRAVSVHLTARGAALLKKLRRLPVLVLVTAQDPLGDPGLASLHIVLATPSASKAKR